MTFLNTMSNLGTNWPNTLALWAIDHLTFKECSYQGLSDNTCSSEGEETVSKTSYFLLNDGYRFFSLDGGNVACGHVCSSTVAL